MIKTLSTIIVISIIVTLFNVYAFNGIERIYNVDKQTKDIYLNVDHRYYNIYKNLFICIDTFDRQHNYQIDCN